MFILCSIVPRENGGGGFGAGSSADKALYVSACDVNPHNLEEQTLWMKRLINENTNARRECDFSFCERLHVFLKLAPPCQGVVGGWVLRGRHFKIVLPLKMFSPLSRWESYLLSCSHCTPLLNNHRIWGFIHTRGNKSHATVLLKERMENDLFYHAHSIRFHICIFYNNMGIRHRDLHVVNLCVVYLAVCFLFIRCLKVPASQGQQDTGSLLYAGVMRLFHTLFLYPSPALSLWLES